MQTTAFHTGRKPEQAIDYSTSKKKKKDLNVVDRICP